MIDKSILIILFMYGLSISFLTVEYMFVDVFHLTIENLSGTTLTGASVSGWMKLSDLNSNTADIINGTYTPVNATTFYDKVETSVTAGAAVAWTFIQILTGLYILNLIYFFGVPLPFVVGFGILYVILLARTIIAMVRGV